MPNQADEIREVVNRAATALVLLKWPIWQAHTQGQSVSAEMEDAFLDLRSAFSQIMAEICEADPNFQVKLPFAVWPASNRCVVRYGDLSTPGFEEWARDTGLRFETRDDKPVYGFGLLAIPVATAAVVIVSVMGVTYALSRIMNIIELKQKTEYAEKVLADYYARGGKVGSLDPLKLLTTGGAPGASLFGDINEIVKNIVIGAAVIGGVYVASQWLAKK